MTNPFHVPQIPILEDLQERFGNDLSALHQKVHSNDWKVPNEEHFGIFLPITSVTFAAYSKMYKCNVEITINATVPFAIITLCNPRTSRPRN